MSLTPTQPITIKTGDLISRHMDTLGNGTGVINATGNYSGGNLTSFFITPESNEIMVLHRMIVSLESTSGFRTSRYGNGAALAQGITLETTGDERDTNILTNGESVKTNGEWGNYCFDTDLKTWGSGNELLLVRWSFDKSGIPITLNGKTNDKLELLLNDDFTFLINHKFLAQGYFK